MEINKLLIYCVDTRYFKQVNCQLNVSVFKKNYDQFYVFFLSEVGSL